MVSGRSPGCLACEVAFELPLTSPYVAMSDGNDLPNKSPDTITEWHNGVLPGCTMPALFARSGSRRSDNLILTSPKEKRFDVAGYLILRFNPQICDRRVIGIKLLRRARSTAGQMSLAGWLSSARRPSGDTGGE